jgi:hypothetical protein
VFQVSRRDDVATPVVVPGRAGAAVKGTICGGIRGELGVEARRPGALRWWLRDPARDRRLAAEQDRARGGMLDLREHAAATTGGDA